MSWKERRIRTLLHEDPIDAATCILSHEMICIRNDLADVVFHSGYLLPHGEDRDRLIDALIHLRLGVRPLPHKAAASVRACSGGRK